MSKHAIEGFRLSPQQSRIWSLQRDTAAYNARCAMMIEGDLDRAVLEEAVRLVVERHDILRTTFQSVAALKMPLQVIGESARVELAEVDLTGATPREQLAGIEETFRREGETPFDLAGGPLMRASLLKLSAHINLLLLTLPAISADDSTLSNLFAEISSAYAYVAEGVEQGEEPIRYNQVSEWLNELLEAGDQAIGLRDNLDEEVRTELELPGEIRAGAGAPFRPEMLTVEFDRKAVERVEAITEKYRSTPHVFWLTCWNVLLWRLTGRRRIVVGYTDEGRNYEELQAALGPLSTSLPVEGKLGQDYRFGELLDSLGNEVGSAKAAQEYFVWKSDDAEGGRGASFFHAAFGFRQPPARRRAAGLVFSVYKHVVYSDRFKVKLVCAPHEDTLRVELHYDSSVVERETAERFARHFETLVGGVIERPDAPIGELELFDAAGRARLLEEFNDTAADFPRDKSLPQLFAAQAAATPDSVAVVFDAAATTYAELDRRSNQLARYLRALGVGPESRVGVFLERSPEMILALLGVAKAGAAYVPLNPSDPSERVAYMLGDAGASVLLTQTPLAGELPQTGARVLDLESEWADVGLHSGEDFDGGAAPDNLAYVLYTSGSTGKPKGTLITHRGLVNYLYWCTRAYDVAGGAGAPVHSPITSDLTVTSLFSPLLAGRKLLLLPEEFGVEALRDALVENENFSFVKVTPAHLEMLNQQLGVEAASRCARALVIGGEALTAERVAFWRDNAPGTRLINEYGPTETVVGCAVYEVAEADAPGGVVPIGKPIANTQLYILDERRAPVPLGASGELYIGGEGVARGYLNREELTAEKFVPNPFGDAGARLYRSGDLARYMPDGNIEFLGRIDEQLKIRGYRIEPGEVESALVAQEGVSESVVIAREDEPGKKRLVAYVVGEEGRPAPAASELRNALKGRLPEYMIPAAFVALRRIPLTPNGKVDRKALPAPDPGGQETGRAYSEPVTAAQRLLATIWAQTLGVERVGVNDNFFELGGDSILSIQMVSRANEAGLKFTARQLFQNQTIAELASVAGTIQSVEAHQGAVEGFVPLTPIQRWFLEQEPEEPHHFNQSVMLGVAEEVEARLLKKVLDQLLAHHDALRLRYSRDEIGNWRQFNDGEERNDFFEEVDLSGLSGDERASALDAEANRLEASLDLYGGPLVRAALIDLGPDAGRRLLIVIHHLAMDGVSWRIFLEDLHKGYEQARRGASPDFGAKTTSFRHWSEALMRYAGSEELNRQADYWAGQECAHVGPVPVDYEGGDNTIGSVKTVSVRLSERETSALLYDAPGAYRTQINDLLLTAMASAYEKWAGSPRVRVELEGHGREEIADGIDVSRTVGWFTTLYPVVLEAGGGGVGEQIKRVKEQVRAVPEKGIGYGALKHLSGSWIGPVEGGAEISFNYFGQVDQGVVRDGFFRVAAESAGATRSAKQRRSHLLEVNGEVSGGQLELRWAYSENVHRRETIEALTREYVEALRSIIEHCVSDEAGGYTPSDFPLAGLTQAELDAIVGANKDVEDIYPLAPLQKGLLFHSLYAPGSGEYVVQMSIEIGGVAAEQLEAAWQRVLDAHAVLRSGFVWEGLEEPLQVVRRGTKLPVERIDLRGKGEREQEAEIEQYLAADRAKGFDLREGPLMRLCVMRRGESRHQLVVSHHHITMDGWSSSLVMKQVMSADGEADRGKPYRDYVKWLKGQDLKKAEAFWRETLKGLKGATRLGIDGGAAAANRKGYAEESISLGRDATERLQRVAREHKLTLNTVVEGAWALLLSRYSGERDVVFGATVSGRPADLPGMESMVGLFTNTLPVRVEVREDERVVDWLREIHQLQAEMGQYEYSPLVEVQGWSGVPRGEQLFESLYAFENYPVEKSMEDSGKRVGIKGARAIERTNYPVTVIVAPGAELEVRVLYDRGLYEDEAIKGVVGHFERILGEISARPEGRIAEIEMLGDAERRRLLAELNDTRRDYEAGRGIHELFEASAAATPDRVAVACGDEQITYAELNARANRLAHYLRAKGVGAESLVGVCMRRGVGMVTSLLGVLKAGGAYVPLDPEYPKQRLDFIIEDARVGLLLTLEDTGVVEAGGRAEVVRLDADWHEIGSHGDDNLESGAASENLAYIIYTSGSTGRPKGVAIQHASAVTFLHWAREAFSREATEAVLASTSICFDLSVFELFGPLGWGQRVVVTKDALELAGMPGGHGVTLVNTVPSAIRELVRMGGVPRSVRTVNLAGEALTRSLADEVYGLDHVAELYNLYGPSEDTTYSTYALVLRGEAAKVTIGRPVANTRAYVLDRRMRPVPAGVTGELYLGGEGLARGYFGRPELTAERFLPGDHSEQGGRVYRTGDVVRYLETGEIEYLGRADDQVKIRGFRIELGETEAALRKHPSVEQCVVVAREASGGEKRLAAYVVGARGQEVGVGELRSFLKETLPEHMIPSSFVSLDSLPLSPNGKVDRRALPDPNDAGMRPEDAYAAPRNAVEEILASIWAEVLGVERVGIDDNFFELGGHSLLAIRVESRMREAFRVETSLRALFEEPTVARLAVSVEKALAAARGAESPAIVPAERGTQLPLSFAQERLWFIDQLEPGSPAYNIQVAARLEGPARADALEQSLRELVRRHEVLRTTFSVIDGQPVQVIGEPGGFRLDVVELQHLGARGRAAQVRRLAQEQAQRPFDLSRGPLVRATLLRVAEGEQVLLISIHHIVSDGWSMSLLMKEFGGLFESFINGGPSRLEELAIQYADYAVWQRDWLRGEVLDRQIEYWKKHLGGAPAVVELPTDRPRPAVQTFRGATQKFTVSKQVADRLKSLSRSEGATLFMTTLGAFQSLLHRYTRQHDIVVGTPIANRNRVEVEELIGFFINTLVIRTDMAGDPSFREVVRRVRESALGAYAHQDVPFEKLVEELGAERSLSHTPLVQVMFALDNEQAAGDAPRPSGQGVRPLEFNSETTKFDLSLTMSAGQDGLTGIFEYNTDLFDAATVERMAGHFGRLLEGVSGDAERRLSELEILGEEERRSLLVEWNDTRKPRAADAPVHELFERHAEQSPNRVAVVFEGEQITYGELNRRANRVGNYLRRLGVGPEVLVGISMERGVEMVVGLLGILKAGAAYLPLDPAYPRQKLEYMLEDSQAKVLLTQEGSADAVAAAAGDDIARVIKIDADWDEIASESGENCESGVTANDLAYVIYTSGSTGRPKGTLVEHKGLANGVEAATEIFGVDAEARMIQLASLSFDASAFEIFVTLAGGGTLCLMSSEHVGSGPDMARLLREHSITTAVVPPSVLNLVPAGEFPALRNLMVGAEAVGAEIVARWSQGRQMYNVYGPTEASIYTTVKPIQEGQRQAPPIGRPISNARVYLLDQHFRPVPLGASGELEIGGAGVVRGYLNRPELTAEKFIPDPFGGEAGARLYRTGDLARYLPGGDVDYLGRIDNQVKIRGYRVEPGEIESVLAEHEGVKDAVVVAREGEAGKKMLAAYLVCEDGAQAPAVSELRGHLKKKLPEYMIPSAFVVLDSIPLTPNGKVDRRALPEPDSTRPQLGSYVAPRNRVEHVLAHIWARLLKAERVGINDNFFELGGDSILSIQMVSRAKEAGLRLTAKQLFQNQTIAELAAVADTGRAVGAEQGVVEGVAPLTPIQQWFFEQEMADGHHFNQSVMLGVGEEVEARLLKKVFDHMLAHHDALRMRYAREEGAWRQFNEGEERNEFFREVDLSGLTGAGRSAALEGAINCLQASLDITRGPLVQAALINLGPDAGRRLLVVIHHLAVDAVSWRILVEDLHRGYEQARRGVRIDFGSKTTSFKQWAELLAEYARAEEVGGQAEFWRAQAGAEVRPVPIDFPGGDNTVASVKTVAVRLSERETNALLHDAPAAYRTQINDLLLTAMASAYEKWAGSPRVRVELEGHGREEIEEGIDLSRTVGWFTTLHPVLLEAGGGGVGEQIKRVKEQVRAVPGKGIGYGLLKYSGRRAELAGQAAEISFNYFGQVDQGVERGGLLFSAADESAGGTRSAKQRRSHLLEVNGEVSGGQLELRWAYSENVHRRETIEALANEYVEALRAVVEHCVSDGAGGYTPSDFPLAALTQAELDAIAGESRDIEDIYPLAPLQKGMLFHSLYAPGSGEYVVQMSIAMEGVNIEHVERAWQRVVDSNTVLRSGFVWEGLEEPLQVVRKGVRLPVERMDLRGKGEAEQEAEIEQYLAADRARGFDLRRGPLMRMCVLARGEGRYQVVLSHHHITMDGWSSSLVMKQVMGGGADAGGGRPYRDYIAWLGRQDIGKAEAYWRGKLKGLKGATRLGGDGAGAVGYAEENMSLGAEATERLQRMAKEQKLTLNTVVEGAWALLLSRYSGERDVVFGATVSGRPADLAGMEGIVGLFINTLPVRVEVKEEQSVAAWLSELQSEQAEMGQYEYSPLVEVQGWSDVPRGEPLFESIFVFENYPVDNSVGGRAQRRGVGRTRVIERTNYPLTVIAGPGTELMVRLMYDRSHFDEETIKRVMVHFERILEEIGAGPDRLVSEIEILSEQERRQVLVEWNDTAKRYAAPGWIHDLFESRAQADPDRVALVFEGGHITYGLLNARANQLGRYLQSAGVGPDVVVGVFMERSVEMVLALLGILKAGGAYLPLDPDHPQQRLLSVMDESEAPVVLTQQRLLAKLPRNGAHALSLDSQWDEVEAESADALPSLVTGDNLAYVIYTSGSTGRPKGAMLPHAGILNRLLWMQEAYRLTERDVVVQKTPFGFDVSVWEFFWPLMEGARLVVARPGGHKDSAYLAGLMERERVSVAHFVPSMLQAMLQAGGLERCGALRQVVCSGEALGHELQERFFEAAGPNGTRLDNLYGPTEASVDVTWWACEAGGGSRVVPIGRPIANTSMYVLGSGGGAVPAGIGGELHIGGVGLGRGYLNRPDLTAASFIPNEYGVRGGERLYRTGDLGRHLAGGVIEYLGRIDHQVKIRGNRVELGEIEAALSAQDGIREALVTAREDDGAGKRLVAYLVYEDGRQPKTTSELRSDLAERLPEYMIPTAFVTLDSIPLSANGKADRKALPAPDSAGTDSLNPAQGPQDPAELRLLQIWEEALGRGPVGIRDNFFDLGGHSLLAIRIMSKVHKEFGVSLPLDILFREATVERLARILRQEVGIPRSAIVPIQPRGTRAPFFCVHPGSGFVFLYSVLARHLGPEQPFYGIQDPTLYGDGDPDMSLEERAGRYVAALREVQKEGPYYIGGWSFGGHVAFEMAQQLRREGQEVALLALFDTGSPTYTGPEVIDDAMLLATLVADNSGDSSVSVQALTEDLRRLGTDEQLDYAGEWIREHGLPGLRGVNLGRLLTLFKSRIRVVGDYRPEVYGGRITLFRAVDEAASTVTDTTMGWGEFTTEPVETHDIPGTHATICKEPSAQTLAERLKSCLDAGR